VKDDLTLLNEWREGSKPAGEQLFARHFEPIYRFFEHKARSDSDELVQRTFVACVGAREQFRAESSFRTYLFAIARRELYAYLRTRKRDEQLDFEITSLADLGTSPTGRLAKAQARDSLLEALARLPAEQQLLLELHYWHELDASALAEIFSVPPGTIRVRLLRARMGLRARMQDPGLPSEVAADPMGQALLQLQAPDEAAP